MHVHNICSPSTTINCLMIRFLSWKYSYHLHYCLLVAPRSCRLDDEDTQIFLYHIKQLFICPQTFIFNFYWIGLFPSSASAPFSLFQYEPFSPSSFYFLALYRLHLSQFVVFLQVFPFNKLLLCCIMSTLVNSANLSIGSVSICASLLWYRNQCNYRTDQRDLLSWHQIIFQPFFECHLHIRQIGDQDL